jgi:hypothetical protein
VESASDGRSWPWLGLQWQALPLQLVLRWNGAWFSPCFVSDSVSTVQEIEVAW